MTVRTVAVMRVTPHPSAHNPVVGRMATTRRVCRRLGMGRWAIRLGGL